MSLPSTRDMPGLPRAQWLRVRELGSRSGMAFLAWAAAWLGRRALHPCLALLSVYYVLTASRSRRASADYLRRTTGHASWIDVWRHHYFFARCTLDRLYFASGRLRHFAFHRRGTEHLRQLAAAKRGALLLGAHIGSFEAMRAIAADSDLPVHVLVHQRNAAKIAAFLQRFSDARATMRMIEIEPGEFTHLLQVRDCIESGGLVAMLADRTGLNERSVTARFFAAPAAFPAGPFIVAALLRCPVYLVFGLFEPPRTYHLYCEPFAERVEIDRGRREADLANYVQRFAARLEHYCRQSPNNWFNFYDFWSADG